jgi:HTH-type transcriptional regulator/antitoxin HigA
VKTSATRITFSRLPTTFEGLVKFHPPRPIHDATGYENTAEIVAVLAVAGPRLNADQADYLELLATLIERYDAENAEKLPVSSGLDLLKYLVAEHDLGGDGLAKILKVDRSVAYRILKGERSLTTTHVKTLGAHFGVSAHVFLG